MQTVLVGEVSDLELVTTFRKLENVATSTVINVLACAPKGVLMIIATYARPWYGGSDAMFLFGGAINDDKISSSSIKFDANKREWTKLSNMTCPRYSATAALHFATSHIFICGGFSYNAVLSTMERYSIVSDTWTTMSSMRFARHGHTSVEWNGFIFVIGGSDKNYLFRSTARCEIFDIACNNWSDLPNMNTSRRNHS